METMQFNSDIDRQVGDIIQFGYTVDEDGDPMGWMGIRKRDKDPSKKFFYEAEVLEAKHIGRWGNVRACTKCRIIRKEETK